MMNVFRATTAEHLRETAALFREYAAIPGIEVCVQSLDVEIASLPGEYAPPAGALLLAEAAGKAAGCVALGDLGGGVCEMRRLFVRPEARGTGAGRALALAALDEARRMGYGLMRLETLPAVMPAAVALYRSLGFREIPPYDGSKRFDGVLHMEMDLR